MVHECGVVVHRCSVVLCCGMVHGWWYGAVVHGYGVV